MVDHIREGVKDGKDTSVCLLNYKADGTPFWNQFFVAALRDSHGNIVNFVGVRFCGGWCSRVFFGGPCEGLRRHSRVLPRRGSFGISW